MAAGFGGRPGPQQIEHRRWSRRGPSTRPRAAWICVSRPRIRFDVAAACLARSSSRPQSMDSSASCSSALDRARGMGHGPDCFGDAERVPGVRFRCSGSPGFRAAWPRRWARLCRRVSSRTGPVHGNGVVFALADIQADEDIKFLWFSITCTSQSQQLIPVLDCPRCRSPASTLRTTIPNCPASISNGGWLVWDRLADWRPIPLRVARSLSGPSGVPFR
ncbi:hypothetical protein SAMN04487914_13916 [Arthrobacter sp. ok909]|nr:hypothetical protein SAMN04487914_13916 [Arthrobacter sp. ok909]